MVEHRDFFEVLEEMQRKCGLVLGDWSLYEGIAAEDVIAYLYPADGDRPPMAVIRPTIPIGQATELLVDFEHRLRRFHDGDPRVFQSYDYVNERVAAVIHDLGTVDFTI